MEIRVLKYFLTIAREENITRAAEQLHITQPTLSRQMMQLEEELGVRLFRRNRVSVTLTEEGRLLRRPAQPRQRNAYGRRPAAAAAGAGNSGAGGKSGTGNYPEQGNGDRYHRHRLR